MIGLKLIVSRRLLPTWHVMPCIDFVLKLGKFFITSLKGNKKLHVKNIRRAVNLKADKSTDYIEKGLEQIISIYCVQL